MPPTAQPIINKLGNPTSLGLVERITVGALHCRSSASCPCADGHDRTRGSFNGQELVAILSATICMVQGKNLAVLIHDLQKIILLNLSEGFFPSPLVVWRGHPPGVVTTFSCRPTPRVQHQASGPHVGSFPHRLNSSRSTKSPLSTRHIVPRVSHLLAVRGPLASLVTVHCLRQNDFIPTGPGQHKTYLTLFRHVARASFDILWRCLRWALHVPRLRASTAPTTLLASLSDADGW